MAGFSTRGIIEGFYGKPWTHDERLSSIEFLAEIGMNAFVYAPKDDLYLRALWRTPYDDADLGRLGELAGKAKGLAIEFTFALSPGLSMRYANEDDFRLLVAKFRQVAALGVSSFALLLDDIPEVLQHPADAERFASLVAAQAGLINRLIGELRSHDAGVRLTVCPTTYWGHGDEPYIVELGALIDPKVALYWTGRAICAAEIETRDATVFSENAQRPPTLWDNFPVNDVAMVGELHIGPYLGREATLDTAAAGLIANAMPLAEASKIGLYSIAQYLRAPGEFDAEQAWRAALKRVAGERDYARFVQFADAVRGSCLCVDDAPELGGVLAAFAFGYSFGDRTAAVELLAQHARELAATAEFLVDGEVENTALQREIRPWTLQFQRGIAALELVARILLDGELDDAGREQVWGALVSLRSHRERVFGDLLDMFLSDLAGEFTLR